MRDQAHDMSDIDEVWLLVAMVAWFVVLIGPDQVARWRIGLIYRREEQWEDAIASGKPLHSMADRLRIALKSLVDTKRRSKR